MSVYCGDGDPVDVYAETFPRAKKPHECGACHETILPLQRYTRISIVWEGTVADYKRCMRCQKLHEHLRVALGKLEDEQWPDEQLNCGHTYEEVHGAPPPDEIAALAFSLPSDFS